MVFLSEGKAQDFDELNHYKYFIVKAESKKQAFAGEIAQEIAHVLHQAHLPVYRSQNDLMSADIQPCDKLDILFKTQKGQNSLSYSLRIDIGFFDCQGKLVYNFTSTRNTMTYSSSNPYVKVAEKALRALGKYDYQYAPASKKTSPMHRIPKKAGQEPIKSISKVVDWKIPRAKEERPNAIAVVIGNQHYQHPDVPEVSYAYRDAAAVKAFLIQAFGYRPENILYYEDASQANFNALFGTANNPKGLLYNYVKPGISEVFVYYSGHGMPDVEKNQAYFVPSDCHPSVIALNGYSVATFYKNLSKIPCKSMNIAIDACFSGLSEGGTLLSKASPLYVKPKTGIIQDDKTTIMLASAENQIASWFTAQEHGLFTYFLLKAWQGKADKDENRSLSLAEVAEYLHKEVSYQAQRGHQRQQNPEIYGKGDQVILTY